MFSTTTTTCFQQVQILNHTLVVTRRKKVDALQADNDAQLCYKRIAVGKVIAMHAVQTFINIFYQF